MQVSNPGRLIVPRVVATALFYVLGNLLGCAPASIAGSNPQPSPLDGACGPANGAVFSNAPADGLCVAGAASAVEGGGPWSWTCAGDNGGTTAACLASPEADPCSGVTCGGNGTCVGEGGVASCECNQGYHARGLDCAANEVPRAPAPPLSVPQSGGRNLFVSPGGSDKNDGLSINTPFKTIQKAADASKPGDTVNVMDGVYTSSVWTVVEISNSGNANAWIVFRGAPGAHPIIKLASANWQGISVLASYVAVDGFEIQGLREAYDYDYAMVHQDEPGVVSTGIVTGYYDGSITVHHVIIRNNRVHDCGGGGIAVGKGDYMTVEYNETYLNAYWSKSGASGISAGQWWAIDGSNQTKNIIRYNISYDNQELVPETECNNRICDGNGIILDRGTDYDSTNSFGPYAGLTLVANNMTYHNGGTGIHAFKSNHIRIINNTSYGNNLNVENGEIGCQLYTSDCIVQNNISYGSAPSNPCATRTDPSNQYDFNIYYNCTYSDLGGTHNLIKDPLFYDPQYFDFRLGPGSPGIDSGTTEAGASPDLLGVTRPQGGIFDRGAYEQ